VSPHLRPVVPMAQTLTDALAVPGVVAVAVINGDGDLLGADQHEEPGFAEAGSLLAAALAAAGVLAESLGGGLEQAVLEYRGGPLILAIAPHAPDTPTRAMRALALRLRSLADLGRARFELPRLLAGAAIR
jgi:predicted regulator of Ras-like GTPase activity (Roadblock/LC7/MglB family)